MESEYHLEACLDVHSRGCLFIRGLIVVFMQNDGPSGGRLMQACLFLVLLIQFILAVLVGKSDALAQLFGTQT